MKTKQKANDVLRQLYNDKRVSDAEYGALWAGINKFETLEERDAELEKLWADLEDLPMDPDTERIEEPFLDFPAGTEREGIWRFFDKNHSKGVSYLLYGDGVDRTNELAKLSYLKLLCPECTCEWCTYCKNGQCRFPFVADRAPHITESDGCKDSVYDAVGRIFE